MDLSDFVLDVGSHRWMFLGAKFATVSELVEQLKKEYMQVGEEEQVQLFMTGPAGEFVIPPGESIDIFQSGDLVRVVKNATKRKRKPFLLRLFSCAL